MVSPVGGQHCLHCAETLAEPLDWCLGRAHFAATQAVLILEVWIGCCCCCFLEVTATEAQETSSL